LDLQFLFHGYALLPNLDAAWLLTVSPRNRQREHSVDIIRAGCLSIDFGLHPVWMTPA
jgi:hypothetical protein